MVNAPDALVVGDGGERLGDVWPSLYMLSPGTPARFSAARKFVVTVVRLGVSLSAYIQLAIYLHLFARKRSIIVTLLKNWRTVKLSASRHGLG